MCIKLVLIKELYYDARPTKSQERYVVRKGLLNLDNVVQSVKLTVPHTSECWPEDGLIRPKYVATIKYKYLYTVVFGR
jgi:hypothetical protein